MLKRLNKLKGLKKYRMLKLFSQFFNKKFIQPTKQVNNLTVKLFSNILSTHLNKYTTKLIPYIFLISFIPFSSTAANPILYPGAQNNKMILETLKADQGSSAAEVYNDNTKKTVTDIGDSSTESQMQAVGDTFGSRITAAMKKKYLSGYESTLPIFGENMFVSPIKLPFIPIHNPEYIISNGDDISITAWGEFEAGGIFKVDHQGNILLPKIGPVHLAGITNKELNSVINSAVKSEFKDNVEVYANLVTAQPIKVFVSGYVLKPGIYAGISSNSILFFLTQAGGIILNQGSFRDIKIVRNGKTIKKVDLYEFLESGNLPYIQLQQMDSIVVGPSMGSIEVTGKVLRPAKYEPGPNSEISINELLNLAGLCPDATKILIDDDTGIKPKQYYISLDEVGSMKAKSGQEITAVADQNHDLLRVVITGAVISPHQLVLPVGTTLKDVMDSFIKFKPGNLMESVQLFRKSIALQQKAAIEANLDQLERDTYLTSPLTSEGALIQTQFAKNVSQFVARARQVEPKGQLVIYDSNDWEYIKLENEDVINIPYATATVRIDGAVVNPTAMIYKPDWTLSDYIDATGGYSNVGDSSKIIVVSLNGVIKANTSLAWYNFWTSVPAVDPGDHIMVLPGTTTQWLTVATSITQAIYQIAVAARTVIPR